MKNRTLYFTTGTSLITTLFHFICCGGSALLAFISGTISIPAKHHLLTHEQMGYMLVFSGLFLGVSFYFAFKKNCCASKQKKLQWCKILLGLSFVMYMTAVYFHLQTTDGTVATNMGMPCH